jgi:hypothetical protein
MQEDTKGEKLRYENESFRIRGCIYEVNKKPGIELKKTEIPYEKCLGKFQPLETKCRCPVEGADGLERRGGRVLYWKGRFIPRTEPADLWRFGPAVRA